MKTTETTKHTAGPWRIEGIHQVEGITQPSPADHAVIRSTEDRWTALVEVSDAEGEANAEFIVRACNCHEELLEALQFVEKYALMQSQKGQSLPLQLTAAVNKALNKAEGRGE